MAEAVKVEAPQDKLKRLQGELKAAIEARDLEMDKDWLEYAQNVNDKFFDGFKKVKIFLDKCVKQAMERYWIISPLGRRRSLYRVLTENPKALGDAGRRAMNSPIQGISSEVGVTAGYLILKAIHSFMLAFDIPMKYFSLYCRAVHDASYFEESFCMLIPAIHINQHVATVGVVEYYEQTFGFKFNLAPEINMAFGANDADAHEWEWDMQGKNSLPNLIKKAVDDLISTKQLAEDKREKVLEVIMHPWLDKDMRSYLQEHFPLLGRKDLDAEICASCEEAGFTPER